MNIYQRMMMQSLTPQQVAAATFGARAMSTPTVVKTDVQSLFNRGARARSVMTERLPYVLGQAGVGLGGLGALGASAKNELVPGITFKHDWSWEWWIGESAHSRHTDFWKNLEQYVPPDNRMVEAARSRWTTLLDMEIDSPEAAALLSLYKGKFTALKNRIDGLIEQYDWTTVTASDSTRNGLTYAYRELNSTLQRFLHEPMPVPPSASAPPAGDGTPTGTKPGTYSRRDEEALLKQTMLTRAQQAADERARVLATQGAITARSGLPSWLLPAGVGVALIGGFFLLRKKG